MSGVSATILGRGFLQSENDEEEYDEPLNVVVTDGLNTLQSTEKVSLGELSGSSLCSHEYLEAVNAIGLDCWDISSWIIFIEEVEQNHAAGIFTTASAYDKILHQFPLSATLWKSLIGHYLAENQTELALLAFEKCLTKCRHVGLWQLYLSTVKSKALSGDNINVISAYENAIQNVGFNLNSGGIWQDYIVYVRDLSVVDNNFVEMSKKISTLRGIFQRAVCIASDRMDAIWSDYQMFEKSSCGGDSMEGIATIAEYSKRYMHAKSIYNERKRLTNGIEFNRFAVPPTQSIGEVQQLENWNRWLQFELTNPDNLEPIVFRNYIRMVFDQFLCCFLYNVEVWLSLANFVLKHSDGNTAVRDALDVFRQAIVYNPTVVLLRVGMSELEECGSIQKRTDEVELMTITEYSVDDVTAAENTLREAYVAIPNGFTFSLYQRFVRRHRGKIAARRLFGATLPHRNVNSKLSLELLMSHALLEEEVNCDPLTALKVLNLTQQKHPSCVRDIVYIRTVFRVLTQLGRIEDIRWLYQTASSYVPTDQHSTSSVTASSGGTKLGVSVLGDLAYENAKFELELLEEYLSAETVLNVLDTKRLNDIRDKRMNAKIAFDEQDRIRFGAVAGKTDIKSTMPTIFDSTSDLVERFVRNEQLTHWLPEVDRQLRDRSDLNIGDSINQSRVVAQGIRRENEVLNMSAEFHLSLAGLPIILRDLLSKLPLHNGPLPDLDSFVKHIKTITLPPRPSEEASAAGLGLDDGGTGTTASWLVEDDGEGEDAAADTHVLLDSGSALKREAEVIEPDEDLFRKRQRSKVTAVSQ